MFIKKKINHFRQKLYTISKRTYGEMLLVWSSVGKPKLSQTLNFLNRNPYLLFHSSYASRSILTIWQYTYTYVCNSSTQCKIAFCFSKIAPGSQLCYIEALRWYAKSNKCISKFSASYSVLWRIMSGGVYAWD